jgi:hypothetical protein
MLFDMRMTAKPTIDAMVAVNETESPDKFNETMTASGYCQG